MAKYRNPHGQLKENLFLPLFNTNFISKFEINALAINAGKGTRHFNPVEDRIFSTTGSVGLKRSNNGGKINICLLVLCHHLNISIKYTECT